LLTRPLRALPLRDLGVALRELQAAGKVAHVVVGIVVVEEHPLTGDEIEIHECALARLLGLGRGGIGGRGRSRCIRSRGTRLGRPGVRRRLRRGVVAPLEGAVDRLALLRGGLLNRLVLGGPLDGILQPLAELGLGRRGEGAEREGGEHQPG